MKQKEEKCCGNCCWFYGEQTDGEGMCIVHQFDGDDLPWYCCTMSACADYVSRQEMRHHMAVLLQADRWYRATHDEENSALRYMPDPIDYRVALAFAYQYMKVFSKL